MYIRGWGNKQQERAMKTFYTQDNIGNVKYVVNFHDGVKTHGDGSPFFDIKTFRNKKLRDKFCEELKSQGYQLKG
jgi:hypothetical protein